jgi:hypothetical protein
MPAAGGSRSGSRPDRKTGTGYYDGSLGGTNFGAVCSS